MKKQMVKAGIIQTRSYKNNETGIKSVAKILGNMGKNEVELVCLPEQWLKDNIIADYDKEFSEFKKISREFSMTIIPGAFYEKTKTGRSISAPVISSGEIIGKQEKIHPFDYEKDLVKPGKQARVFETVCRFGVIVCYDMVFPRVANMLVKKGAQILVSPSRIVKRGITPWKMYVQVRALENRVPIIAANVSNNRFGGNSIIVDMAERDRVMVPKVTIVKGEHILKNFNLTTYERSRKERFSDYNKFI